ncbi:MAG: sugar ABC transporter permease [Pleurocapsa minor GSE-CHR-MK-17-07R]|jgi:ABC-type maltose transport system permease subunit|nr:sugar ABC transporter permease [Pleurocapsa minor GSE-CHR-MK 17-07R]
MNQVAQSRTKLKSDRDGMVVAHRTRGMVLRFIILVLASMFALYPMLIVVGAAFDPHNTLVGARIIPQNPSLDNFALLFSGSQTPILRWLLNSILVSGISTIIVLTLTTLAAYSLSRFRFRGRRTTLTLMLVVQVFPTVASLVAFYLLLDQLGNIIPILGLNTLGGLILLYCSSALGANAFLMKGYFDTIPRELDESAKVDGAGEWTTFTSIILPLIRPILAVIGILTFIGTFNDFLLPRVFLRDAEVYTLAVGLSTFIGNNFAVNWGVFAAGALIGALPITVVFLLLQTQFISGLAQGAVKG